LAYYELISSLILRAANVVLFFNLKNLENYFLHLFNIETRKRFADIYISDIPKHVKRNQLLRGILKYL